MKLIISVLLFAGLLFGATGFNASCPGSTTVNTPIICTVTLTPTPSYFLGTEVITLTPSANVTLSKSGAWHPSIGPFSFSFVFTDPIAETGTITFTNSQGWSNPPPISVTVTSPAPPNPPAGLTIGYVQGVGCNSNGNATTLTCNISPTSGNTVILGVSLYDTIGPPYAGPTVVDNLGHSYTLDTLLIFNYTTIYLSSSLYHLKVGAGVTSFTVTRGDGMSSYISAIAGEYTNVADNPVDFADMSGDDNHNGIPGCGGCWNSGPIATTNSSDVVIGYAYQSDSSTLPPGDNVSPWTLVASTGDNFGGGTGLDSASMVYQIVTAPGAYMPVGNVHYAIALAVGYKAAPQSTAGAGKGIDLSTVRAQNTSFTAMAHTSVICEGEISDLSSVTTSDGMAELNAAGVNIDYSNSTTLRFASDWITGESPSVITTPISSYVNGYIYWRTIFDNAGTIGPAKTFYAQAWDDTGVQQLNQSITYTGDSGYSNAGVYVGQTSNTTVQRVHFIRCGTTLVPLTARSPATADVGPLNSGSWSFQWKFDGTLADSSGNGWTATMSDSSTPSGTCGSTATSYCSTLYQVPIPIITSSAVTWRAGVAQSPSCANSFSQSNTSSVISDCFWQALSGPSTPIWSSNTTTSPTMNNLQAGDYNLQLQVTDATPQTATITQHMGVVATDTNDIIVNTAGLPTATQTNIIMGPLQKWMSGLAPYPLFDILEGDQWSYRSGPSGDFQNPINGASSYQTGTNYFDYAQPGNLTATQFSNTLTGVGTSWLSLIGDAGDAGATATVYTSVEAGIHTSDTFTVTSSNNIIKLAFDGGSSVTVTLATGSQTPAQIAAGIQSAIGAAGTATPDYNGLLIKISTATVGTAGSVAVQTVANNAYTLFGLTVGTFTVANNPQPNMTIIPWYLAGTAPISNPAYATGRRQLTVLQVLSNTALIIEQANGLNWRFPTQIGLQYAVDKQAWPYFYYSDNNGNYYDNALADYYKAFKTGVASDLAQARSRADRWFRGPKIDLGQEYTTSDDSTTITGSGNSMISRQLGLMGVILRALDGQPNYWTGLEYIIEQDVGKLTGAGSNIADIYTDQREFGYALQRVAACALFDPGSYANTCRGTLVSVTSNIITPSRNAVDGAYPYWPVPYYTQASFAGDGSVCVTNGSTTVTGSGTAFHAYGSGSGLSTIWFFPTPGTRPPNNATGDSAWYNVTYVSATSLTLSSAYSGTTKCTGTSGVNAGYMLFDGGVDVPYVGWGAQPFMEGLMNIGFAMSSLATACTSPGVPTNCNSTTSALLAAYVSQAGQWIANVGYQASSGGVYQGANFVNCSPPSGNSLCNAGNLPYGARVIAEESAGGVSWAYRFTGTTALKTNADAQFSAAWSNANGIPDYNPPSGGYVGTPGNVASFKYYGLEAGIAAQPSYQAVQLCAGGTFPCLSPVAPPNPTTLSVSVKFPYSITNAASIRCTFYFPNGATETVSSSNGTCSIADADLRQGTQYQYKVEYLSGGGATLSSPQPQGVTVQ